ncbi:hypothetical protein PG994_006439 [Apiospora phragmitis]|uniref:Uncharacterized protein n=1 Tax=Apiospora phragmitis TaxID=2905665 RepID=A0ABR1VF20_9PEZI
MCRRTVVHRMHHDVRTPVVLDIDGGEGAPLYAHPFRTTKHVCDINIGQSLAYMRLPIQAGEGTETGEPHPCDYHSCCVCLHVIDRCRNAGEDQPEPEECAGFTLEHRHAQLNVQRLIWGQWARIMDQLSGEGESCAGSNPVVTLPTGMATEEERQQGNSLPEPPKWHELTDVNAGQEWRPVFRRDQSMYLGWVAWMFDHLADLQTYREWDARVCAELRVRGLAGGIALMDLMATTSTNVRVREQFIRDELRWAATPPY